MPIVIRLREPAELPYDLRQLLRNFPDQYQLELWSDDKFRCPLCLAVLDQVEGQVGGSHVCPQCGQRFWTRWLPWAAAISSTDDPALRHPPAVE